MEQVTFERINEVLSSPEHMVQLSHMIAECGDVLSLQSKLTAVRADLATARGEIERKRDLAQAALNLMNGKPNAEANLRAMLLADSKQD